MTEDEQRARNELVDNELETLTEAVQDLVRVARQHESKIGHHEGRIALMESLSQQLVEIQIRADARADRADERADRADARADRADARMTRLETRFDKFEARLDKFLDNFERYLNGSNGAGGNGASGS